jgi:chromatin modification-related protein YNG2
MTEHPSYVLHHLVLSNADAFCEKISHPPDIQLEIQKEASKYIRHTLRNVQAQSQSGTPLPSPIPTKEKDAQLPAKIQASYAEIDKLADEKLELSQRIVELINRARARLDHDLSKVLILQGDTPEVLGGLGSSPSNLSGHNSFTLGGRNPVNQINESLRNAFAGSAGLGGLGPGDVLPLSPVAQAAAAADAHRNKSELILSPTFNRN